MPSNLEPVSDVHLSHVMYMYLLDPAAGTPEGDPPLTLLCIQAVTRVTL